MKIVLISNFLNHYQETLASAFMELGCEYYFIAMMPIPEERVLLGFDGKANQKEYVICAYEDRQRAERVIRESDVIISSWDGRKYLKKVKGYVFVYTERIFKQEMSGIVSKMKNVMRWMKFKYYMARYTNKNTRYLCIGKYAEMDYQRIGVKKDNIYKFAYFPALDRFFSDRVYAPEGVLRCLWVGRFISWKRPEDAIAVVAKLYREGLPVELTMVGRGIEEKNLRQMVKEQNLENCVFFTGSLPVEKVRELMRSQDVFLFTSSEGEGWGATLNEAMSEGMVVFASDGAGATTYLVKNKVNGEIYPCADVDLLYKRLKKMLENGNLMELYGQEAIRTMEKSWNAEQAAQNFIYLVECMQKQEEFDIYDGPVSKA